MKTLLLTLIIIPMISLSVFAQETLTEQELRIRQIEENGFDSGLINVDQELSVLSLNWNSITPATEPFGRSIGGHIGDYVYVFGGQANSSMAAAYNLSTNTWSASTVCNSPAYNSGFCVANGELYKISGTGAVSIFEKFTPNGTGTGIWSSLAAGPTDVMNAQNSVAWDGGDYLYVHSSNYSTTTPASYLSRYSISGNNWVNLTPTSYVKRYPGLTFNGGMLYLVGGLVPTGDDGSICLKYNPTTDTWSTIAQLPEGVNFCKWTTTSVGDYVVLTGSGGGYSTYPSSPKVYYYNTLTDVWTYDGDLPANRGLALGFSVSSYSEIFFGGGNEGGTSTNYQATCWTGDGSFIPVELVSFSSSVSGNDVSLSWITATEVNNSHFEIQRSSNGVGFARIGIIEGKGTSTETSYYSFEDEALNAGHYYYRLKQVDYNGSFEFSNVIEADIVTVNSFDLSQNYPNPFNPSTTINFSISNSGLVSLKVYDVMGNEIAEIFYQEIAAGSHSIEFNAAGLASGTYFYKLQAGNKIETQKMLLLK